MSTNDWKPPLFDDSTGAWTLGDDGGSGGAPRRDDGGSGGAPRRYVPTTGGTFYWNDGTSKPQNPDPVLEKYKIAQEIIFDGDKIFFYSFLENIETGEKQTSFSTQTTTIDRTALIKWIMEGIDKDIEVKT